MLAALTLVSLILVSGTLLPLSNKQIWWVRIFDFPRLQLLSGLVVTVIGIVLWLNVNQWQTQVLLLLDLGSLIYQAAWIRVYTPLFPVEVKAARRCTDACTLTMMNANVLMSNRNFAGFLRLVTENDPDLLVTLETDRQWEEQLRKLEPSYPYSVKCAQDNLYGMHVYSKLPLIDTEIQFLIEPDKPSIHGALELTCGDRVQFHFLHPAPPSPTENDYSSERDAELLIVAKQLTEVKMPVIVSGDLNDVAWSTTTRLFKKISGLLDPRVGRGMYNTYHADYPLIRWPLDHFFHSAHFKLIELRRLRSFGSDHFPLLIHLQYDPRSFIEQQPPKPDSSAAKQANERLDISHQRVG